MKNDEAPSRSLANPVLFLLILSVIAMIGFTLSRGVRNAPRQAAELTPVRFDLTDEEVQRVEAIRRALDRDVTVEYIDVPLEKALVDLAKKLDVPLYIDRATLADEGVALDQPVTVLPSTITGKAALRQLCEPIQLTWFARDEVLFVTTSVRASDYFDIRIYDVADLVAVRDTSGRLRSDFNQLIDTITGTIAEDSWSEVGGPGTIKPVDSGGTAVLTIKQTEQIHSQIAALLSTLRKKTNPGRLPVRSDDELKANRFESVIPVRAELDSSAGTSDPQIAAVVRGNNELAIALYSRLARESKGNVLISPLGVSMALAILTRAASDETAEEIIRTAKFVLPKDTLAAGYSSFRQVVTQRPVVEPGAGDPFARGDLQLASGLWVSTKLPMPEKFVGSLRDDFGGSASQVDFNRADETAALINNWAKERTGGLIPQIVSPRDFTELSAFLIASAVSFHGEWASPFPPQNTRPAPFTTGSAKVEVAMMHADKEHCRHGLIDGVQVLEKPYRSGNRSLVILLPKDASAELSELESQLTEPVLLRWLASTHNSPIDLFLPRFRFDYDIELSEVLKSQGMQRAFVPTEGNFPLIAGNEPTAVERVFHKSTIDVDEKGTKAASAARLQGAFGGGPPVFRADHPFVFLIRDVRTGCILFIGRLVHPSAMDADLSGRG